MKKILTLLLLIPMGLSTVSYAQYDEDFSGSSDVLTIGAGGGFITFFGDLGSDNSLSKYTNVRLGASLNIERRFGNIFGVQFDGNYGNISYNEISNTNKLYRNFESSLLNLNLKAVFHFDNEYVIHRKSPFSPFLSFGVGYTMFDPHGDLLDKNNTVYHYWEDGSIRDLAENDPNAANANRINRDYTYETQLTDSVENYSRGALSIPLTLGFKWKITPRLQSRIYGTYNLIQSDWVDNISENGNNDKFLYTGVSLHYVIRKKDPNKAEYDDIDFDALNNMDSDGDGVIDTDDYCQGTPSGVEVQANGCPKDDDNDGVPNYLDKEENTPAGSIVNEEGVTLTDEMILEREIAYKDSLVEERVQVFAEDPSFDKMKYLEEQMKKQEQASSKGSNIPEHLKEADIDKDGFISAKEISATIDGFFEGSNDFTVKSINELVDFFFEQ